MNQFGGNWTEKKMEIVNSYARAYLTIMKEQEWAKTIYFDGFAGSGRIEQNILYAPMPENSLFGELVVLPNQSAQDGMLKGTALRILDIVDPKPFDMYYFVEKDEDHFKELSFQVKTNYPGRKAYVVQEDCNKKLVSLANYLRKNKNYRVLAFIDPYGMSVKWSSIEELKNLGIDLWILVPTGVGANRMLVKDGNISESWLYKLETFLGIEGSEIKSLFYRPNPYIQPLFESDE
jgi:three-Cys-motif partner protein